MSDVVSTVLGDVSPRLLGHVQPHEHLLIDIGLPLAEDVSPQERARQWEPITLANYYATRRDHTRYDLVLDNEAHAIESMREYRSAGGGTVVDATSIGLSRDPEGLARIARGSGVHVVMGSSYYYRDYHPDHLEGVAEGSLTAQIVDEITCGVGESGIRAGIIGEVGLSWPHHDVELKVLRASAHAQQETGAALMIHPGRDPRSPMSAVRDAVAAGADPGKIIMSHIDRTIFSREEMFQLADTGCVLEFDLFGQETSYYSLGDIDMPNDATRVGHLSALLDRGHVGQLLVSQDICHKTNLRQHGGEGYTHILDHVLPLMRRKGVSDGDIDAITRANPARLLSITRT